MPVHRIRLVSCLAAAAWAVSGGVAFATAQGANALPLRVFQRAVENARTTHARLAGPPPRVVPGNAQYRSAMTMLQAGRLIEAQTAMQAAVRADSNSALYRGDLAAIQIGMQDADAASLQLVLARNKQPRNLWYQVALSAVMAMRLQYPDASLNLDVAVAGDSSIIDSTLAEAGVAWAWRARRMPQLTAWSQLATSRYPQLAEPWYRLASYYQQQRDTTRGVQAIQRYIALRPTDRQGLFLYAVFLFNLQRNDSALVLALQTVQDSALRTNSAEILFGVGARALQANSIDTAMLALPTALENVTPDLRPRVSLFLGYAELGNIAALDGQAERNRACDIATRLDTLVTTAARHLEAGMALDSARVAGIVNGTLPQYRQRSAAMVTQYCGRRRND